MLQKLKRLRNRFTGWFKHKHKWSHADEKGVKHCRTCPLAVVVKRRTKEGKS